MNPLDIGIKLLGLAAQTAPVIADFIRKAVDANPDHAVSKRVSDVLPVESASEHALKDLSK